MGWLKKLKSDSMTTQTTMLAIETTQGKLIRNSSHNFSGKIGFAYAQGILQNTQQAEGTMIRNLLISGLEHFRIRAPFKGFRSRRNNLR